MTLKPGHASDFHNWCHTFPIALFMSSAEEEVKLLLKKEEEKQAVPPCVCVFCLDSSGKLLQFLHGHPTDGICHEECLRGYLKSCRKLKDPTPKCPICRTNIPQMHELLDLGPRHWLPVHLLNCNKPEDLAEAIKDASLPDSQRMVYAKLLERLGWVAVLQKMEVLGLLDYEESAKMDFIFAAKLLMCCNLRPDFLALQPKSTAVSTKRPSKGELFFRKIFCFPV